MSLATGNSSYTNCVVVMSCYSHWRSISISTMEASVTGGEKALGWHLRCLCGLSPCILPLPVATLVACTGFLISDRRLIFLVQHLQS